MKLEIATKLGVIATIVASALQVNATPVTSQLELVNGIHTATGSPVGANSENFNGTVGTWNVSINASGSTLDPYSSAPQMDLDINAAKSSSTTPSSPLDIFWSTEGFGVPTPESIITELDGIGQLKNVSVSFKTWYGTGVNNGYNGYTGLLGGPLSSPGNVAGLIPGSATAPYSVTLELILTPKARGAASATSIDGGLTFVPDGGMTLSMFGCGLVGLAGLRSRFGSKAL